MKYTFDEFMRKYLPEHYERERVARLSPKELGREAAQGTIAERCRQVKRLMMKPKSKSSRRKQKERHNE